MKADSTSQTYIVTLANYYSSLSISCETATAENTHYLGLVASEDRHNHKEAGKYRTILYVKIKVHLFNSD